MAKRNRRLTGVKDPWDAKIEEHLFSKNEAIFFPEPPPGWREQVRRRWDSHARVRKMRFHCRAGEYKGVSGVFCWVDANG